MNQWVSHKIASLRKVNKIYVTAFPTILVTNAVDTDNLILDGVELERVIPLNQSYVPNETIFRHLQVTESLETNPGSTVKGPHLEEFLANPTLLQTTKVEATCVFRNLIVRGNVIVKGFFNDHDIDQYLSNVVYANEEEGVIEVIAIKDFRNVTFLGLVHLETEFLNGKFITKYVTKSSTQVLELSTVQSGNFLFTNLELDGLYDFVNVTEMDINTVKTYGEQFTDSELIFALPEDVDESLTVDVEANQFSVLKLMNGLEVEEFIDVNEYVELDGQLEIRTLEVERLYLNAELLTSPVINGKDLIKFDQKRLSKSRRQAVTGSAKVINANVGDIRYKWWNDINRSIIETQIKLLDNHLVFLEEGRFKVEELHVNGDVNVQLLNKVDFKNLLTNIVWLNESNVFVHDAHFLDEIEVENRIYLPNSLNTEEQFMEDVVWRKSAESPSVGGFKTFQRSVSVKGHIFAGHVNGIKARNILSKFQNIIKGDVKIPGGLTVRNNLTVETNWRITEDKTIRELSSAYEYDLETQTHIIRGDLIDFIDHPKIRHLNVGGSLNGNQNLQDLLRQIIRKDTNLINLHGPMALHHTVGFRNGLDVQELNGIHVDNLFDNAVLLSEEFELSIFGKVHFRKPFQAHQLITVKELIIESVNECSLADWSHNSILKSENAVFNGKFNDFKNVEYFKSVFYFRNPV